MATAIFYYTLGGFTRKVATKLAEEQNADLFEIKEKKHRTLLRAFVPGCAESMQMKKVPIKPIDCDFSKYDYFIIAAPVWAGYPAPALHSMLELLPQNAKLEIIAVSGKGGSSGRPKVKSKIYNMGFDLQDYKDIMKDVYLYSDKFQEKRESALEKEKKRSRNIQQKWEKKYGKKPLPAGKGETKEEA